MNYEPIQTTPRLVELLEGQTVQKVETDGWTSEFDGEHILDIFLTTQSGMVIEVRFWGAYCGDGGLDIRRRH